MACTLEHFDYGVLAQDMEDGRLGVITHWRGGAMQENKVIQRHGEIFMVLGEGVEQAFTCLVSIHNRCRVDLIEEGDLIRVGPYK